MLILRSEQDVPISIRHIAHLLQNSSTRIKVVLLENTKDTPYYDLATDKLHIVQSYIFELKRLGDENAFDFGAYQRHVQTIQQMYMSTYEELVNDSSAEFRAIQETKPDVYQELLELYASEWARNFNDEIQMSSINRLERLQELVNAKSLSAITGILPIEGWTANEFMLSAIQSFDLFKDLENTYVSLRTSKGTTAQTREEFVKLYLDDEISNKYEELITTFLFEERKPEMIEKYNEIFIPSDEVTILIANVDPVITGVMKRGGGAKLMKDHLAEVLDKFVELDNDNIIEE